MGYQNLIKIINDSTARADEIDDAIMYLREYNNEEVIEFLFLLSNKDIESYMLSSVGESIGEIFSLDKDLYNIYKNRFDSLPEFVKNEAKIIMESTSSNGI